MSLSAAAAAATAAVGRAARRGRWEPLRRRVHHHATPVARATALLERKREGEHLPAADVAWFAAQHRDYDPAAARAHGAVTPQQAAALLMSLANGGGADDDELLGLCEGLRDSGRSLEWADGPSVALYSGIGDKTSLIVAPVCVACGVRVPKISDRGFVGGVVDKLECIPGMDVNLSAEAFQGIVEQAGAAMVAPFADLAPADKPLRQIRDQVGCRSLGLIAASIVGRKLACNSEAIIFDVKTGSGDFVPDKETALELAEKLVQLTSKAGKKACAFVTGMQQPLGAAIGSSLELAECLSILRGARSPASLRDISTLLAAQALLISEKCSTLEEGLDLAIDAIESGKALAAFRAMVAAQGGDLAAFEFEHESRDPSQRAIEVLHDGGEADEPGFLSAIDVVALGELGVRLGAARGLEGHGESIDHGSGIEINCSVSDPIAPGTSLCTLYTRREHPSVAELEAEARRAFSISQTAEPLPLVFYFVDHTGATTKLH